MSGEAIVGRDGELGVIRELLDEIPSGLAALVVEGQEGIGKTALWAETLDEAGGRGYITLVSRPAPAEAQLSFSGLADLLLDRLEEVLPGLPVPQRHALEVALMLEQPEGSAPDPLAIALAFRGALRSLSEASPVLVAVDDASLLDVSTAQVLSFALRRLVDRPLGVLVVARPGDERVPLDLDQAVPEGRLRRLKLGPLGPDELDAILRSRLGKSLLRPHLEQLARESGGNPAVAIEIVEALARHGVTPVPGEPLPVPEGLRELVRDRLASLPTAVRDALLVVAVLSIPTLEVLTRAGVADQVMEAVRAGVLVADDDGVRFANPLMGSVVNEDAPPSTRRRVHRNMAEIVETEEERARHLALATETPDEEVATLLEEAARSARARGSPYTAAELGATARALTPAEDAEGKHRRGLSTAEYLLDAGDVSRARAVLEELVADSPHGDARAAALQRLGWVRFRQESWIGAAQLFDEALGESALLGDVEATLELDTAMAHMLSGDLPRAARHGERARALADRLGRPDVLGEALAVTGSLDFLMGQGLSHDVMEQAEALESWDRARPTPVHPSVAYGLLLKWSDDLDGARKRLTRALERSKAAGNERSLPFLMYHLSELECWAGDWSLAALYAADAGRQASQTGQESSRAFTLHAQALVDALRGETDRARARSLEGLELAERSGARPVAVLHAANLGFIELSLSDPARANRYLGPLAAGALEAGIQEPGVVRYIADAIEALIGVGDVERAGALVDELQDAGRRVGRAWALAAAARCRALLFAAHGDLEQAIGSAEMSLAHVEVLGQPFELGRTLLVLGALRRRDRRKKDARDVLERAREVFESLGASVWAERTAEELGRIGGRAPAPLELTPTERRVAALATEGRTNQEVARTLFMSVKTVEWNLSRIYRKAGVRSRTELARWLAAPTP